MEQQKEAPLYCSMMLHRSLSLDSLVQVYRSFLQLGTRKPFFNMELCR